MAAVRWSRHAGVSGKGKAMIFSKLMGQFVDVIQWTDDSPDTMVWRFERQGNEIKYGAKLTDEQRSQLIEYLKTL